MDTKQAPRLLRREQELIVDGFLRWLHRDSWNFIYSADNWINDFRYGRAVIDLTRGQDVDISEIRANPEMLITEWRPRG